MTTTRSDNDDFNDEDYKNAPENCEYCPSPCEETHFKIEKIMEKKNEPAFLSVSVYYETLYMTRIEEEIEYSASELIAEFGGLLGLLAGGSLLSFIEIFIMVVLFFARKFRGRLSFKN